VFTISGKRLLKHRGLQPLETSTNKGLNRFSLRGKTKVQGQWQLDCMVHNLEKVSRYGKLA
jgi:hypothetical protein